MVTTTFTVATEAQLNTALESIEAGSTNVATGTTILAGPNAASDTQYTITIAPAANSTLTLSGGNIAAVNLESGSSLSIIGNGNTIDGAGQYRGFFAYAGSLTISDLTIRDTAADGGGGGAGFLTGSGGGGGAGLGGGLFVGANASVTLTDVSFSGDQATGGTGGAGVSGGATYGTGGGGGLGGAGAGGYGAGGGSGVPGITGYTGGNGAHIGNTGGTGQFGAGGGGRGGAGGFGGGGGAGYAGGQNQPAGTPGYGGGTAGTGSFQQGAGGGGGLGAGGAIFVEQGGSLIEQAGTISGGSVTGGAGGSGTSPGSAGKALGSGIFIQGSQAVTLAPAAGSTLLIGDAIAGQGTMGTLRIVSGTVVLAGTNTFAGSTTIHSGSVLQLGDGGATGGLPGNIRDQGTLVLDATALLQTGTISDTGGVIVQGGAATLTAANTFSGKTTIEAGSLQLGAGGTTGSVTGNIIDNATLALNETGSFGNVISGSGGLAVLGGNATLTAKNTFAGDTTITAGTLQLGAGKGTGSVAGNIVDNSTLVLDNTALLLNGTVSGSGGLIAKAGAATLTAENGLAGTSTIQAGVLVQVGSGSITGNIVDNGTLVLDGNPFLLGGTISGSGQVIQTGAGAATLAAASTFTGSTTIQSGTLQLGNGGAAGSVTGTIVDNGILALDGTTLLLGGTLSGSGSLMVLGGSATLTAADTLAGGMTIAAGALQLGNGGSIGSVTDSILNDSTLVLDSSALTVSGTISGTGGLIQEGTGAATLAATNLYTGPTSINRGTLVTDAVNAIGANALNVAAGAVFNLNGFAQAVGDLSGVGAINLGSASLTIDETDATFFAGTISGTGGLVLQGGTLTLDDRNGFSGGTTLQAGELLLAAPAAAGTGPIILDNHATLAFAPGNMPTEDIRDVQAGNVFDIFDVLASGQPVLEANNVLFVPGVSGSVALQLDPTADLSGLAFQARSDGSAGTDVDVFIQQFTVATGADLNAAIAAISAGGTDAFPATAYTIDIAQGFTLGTLITEVNLLGGSSLTINGDGATIDGGGANRGFFAYAGALAINELTIADMLAQGGNGGPGNFASGGGGGGLGGGLFVAATASVALSGVSFVNDQAAGGHGGQVLAFLYNHFWVGSGGGGMLGTGSAVGGSGVNGAGGGSYAGPGSFGGGGGSSNHYGTAGDGGFGGGGGGGGFGAAGGFGGAGGGGIYSGKPGGFGGGFGNRAGGGGLGAGGAIFVEQGGTLTIGAGDISGGTVIAGAGGTSPDGRNGGAGGNFGSGIFIQGTQSVTLAPAEGQTLTIEDVIADQSGSDPANIYGQPASGELILGGAGTIVLDGSNTFSGTISFAGSPVLQLSAAAVPGGQLPSTVEGFIQGDTIDLSGLIFESGATATIAGGTLTVTSGAITDTLPITGIPDGTPFVASPDNSTGTDFALLCFCAGTRIATPAGEVPVEHLAVGDSVVTASGVTRPIAWIGTGRVLATRGRRNAATPVLVMKGALAPNVPNRDLRLTKGHALYIDGALIPVEELVNHRSILWDDRAQEVSIYHVELETHDVLLANGAPAESYRDDGNRWLFQNSNSAWEAEPRAPCAPILSGGPVVDEVWQRLLKRAGTRPGFALTEDPDLHLLVNGQRVDCDADRVFRLPSTPDSVRIVSRSASPQELGLARDPRVLGVALSRIVVNGTHAIEAGDERLSCGFHSHEAAAGFRWTNGDACLPTAFFEGLESVLALELHVAETARYPVDGPCREAA